MWYRIESNQDMLVEDKKYLVVDCDFEEETIVVFKLVEFCDDEGRPMWEGKFVKNEITYCSDGDGLFEYMIPMEELTNDKTLNYNNAVLANTDTGCSSCKNYSPK